MEGLPILADDDLRQAVSPRKLIQPIHRSLSIEENDMDGRNDHMSPNNPTTKIINEYRSLGGVTGVSLNPPKNKWNPPPLPIEQMYDNYDEYDNEYDERYDERYDDDDSERSDIEYVNGDEDDDESSVNDTTTSQDDELIRGALQVFYDQKRNTVQNLKSNKVANDPFLFVNSR